ncbi:MAG: hypothetical protein Q9201_000761 [Fulgogasparrea decipioides]
MLVPTLLSAGFAFTANAFLLPPEAASTFEAAKNKNAPHVVDPLSRTIALDCSNCPFALASERNGRREWTNGVKSDLQLEFTAEDDKLKLNGVPFYPVNPPFAPAPLVVKQSKKAEGDKVLEGYDGDLKLSYTLEIDSERKHFPAPRQDATLTEITLSILGLDTVAVHVDDIKIKALSLPNSENIKHELIIVSVDIQPTDHNSADARCGTIFCRAMYKFRSAVRKAQAHAKTAAHKVKCFCIKGIHAFRPGHYRPSHRPATTGQIDPPVRLPTHNRVRPGDFKPHRHHGHRHHSGWVHAFARASGQLFSFVILPVLVGIVFGIAASAIGMLVGQIIVAVWLRLRRNSNTAVAYEPVASEEKEGLPKYEDLEDTKSVTDEKV